MRSYWSWAALHGMKLVFFQEETQRHRHREKTAGMRGQRRGDATKDRGGSAGHICPRGLRSNQPCPCTLISDLQPPGRGDHTFPLLKPPHLWCFVTVAPVKELVVSPTAYLYLYFSFLQIFPLWSTQKSKKTDIVAE